ncbi:MAG TPA: single-stranded DNA-binding protein [Saprospiraceae bacterium]|nr:single-stranded DNA-binding protein [Saprospiraceae bacterium]
MNNLRNHVLLIGRLGQDVEFKKLNSDKAIARVSLATNESYKKDNEWVTETQWHRIVAWGNLAERMSKQLKKGQQVTVQGKLKYNTFEDRNGITRTIAQVVINEFLITGTSQATANASASATA